MDLIEADPYSRRVIGCAIEVHRTLGPGLIESVYEACLCHELTQAGMAFVRQQRLPVIYKGFAIECDLRMDIVFEQTLMLKIKSVQARFFTHASSLLGTLGAARNLPHPRRERVQPLTVTVQGYKAVRQGADHKDPFVPSCLRGKKIAVLPRTPAHPFNTPTVTQESLTN